MSHLGIHILYSTEVLASQFHADFKDDPELYVFPKLKYVGVELWQVIAISYLKENIYFVFRDGIF